MAVLVLLVLLVGMPILELYVLVQVAGAIGVLEALAVMLVISIAGAWLAKRQGLRTWARFNQQVAQGKVPSKEIADGVCLLLAGALLLAPGFVTDVFGVLLLLPPIRAIVRRTLLPRMSTSPVVIRYGPGTHGRIGDVLDVDGRESPGRPDDQRGELGR